MTILVPYRDREEHLKEFVVELGARHNIVVIEQCDEKPFNRGKLINVGYLETLPTCFVAHDVDKIGVDAAYGEMSGVVQLCGSQIQKKDYLGGVTMFSATCFPGYHNDYYHRAEDNEMMFHLKRIGQRVLQWHWQFRELPHPRSGPEFIPELWQKAKLPRTRDMLKTCEYQLISKEIKEGYTLIKVLL